MPDALAHVSDQLLAVAVDHLGVLGALGDSASGVVLGVGDAEDGGPLLELLVRALRPD